MVVGCDQEAERLDGGDGYHVEEEGPWGDEGPGDVLLYRGAGPEEEGVLEDPDRDQDEGPEDDDGPHDGYLYYRALGDGGDGAPVLDEPVGPLDPMEAGVPLVGPSVGASPLAPGVDRGGDGPAAADDPAAPEDPAGEGVAAGEAVVSLQDGGTDLSAYHGQDVVAVAGGEVIGEVVHVVEDVPGGPYHSTGEAAVDASEVSQEAHTGAPHAVAVGDVVDVGADEVPYEPAE